MTKKLKPPKPTFTTFPPEFFERAERDRQLVAAGQPLPPLVLPGTPFLGPLTATMGGGEVPRTQPREAPPMPERPEASWGRIDLSAHLDGTHVPQVPELLARTDGARLLYRGRVHSFHGESESGKSWVALVCAAQTLASGTGQVLMLDYESDASTVVGRLLALGVGPEVIRQRFDYRRPERPPNAPEEEATVLDLMDGSYELVILDGVTEALSTFNVRSSMDNDEVASWLRGVPRRLATATGAAVVLVDHVTKDADGRGRFAIGAQAKMAGLDGASYTVEVIEPIGVGMLGRIALRVGKDRPGNVRPHAGKWRKGDRTQGAAVVVLDSREAGRTVATVEPPRADAVGQQDGAEGASTTGFRPTYLMEQVSVALEKANAATSRKGIERLVKGRANNIRLATDRLISEGYCAADGPSSGGHPTIRSVKPFRERLEFAPEVPRPTSSHLVPDEVQIPVLTSSPRPVSIDGTRDEVDLVCGDDQ